MDKFLSGKLTDRYNTPVETEKDMVALTHTVNDISMIIDDKLGKEEYGRDQQKRQEETAKRIEESERKASMELFDSYVQYFWVLYRICTNGFVRFLNFFGHWYVIEYDCFESTIRCAIRAPKDKEDFRHLWKVYNSKEGKELREGYERMYHHPMSYGV